MHLLSIVNSSKKCNIHKNFLLNVNTSKYLFNFNTFQHLTQNSFFNNINFLLFKNHCNQNHSQNFEEIKIIHIIIISAYIKVIAIFIMSHAYFIIENDDLENSSRSLSSSLLLSASSSRTFILSLLNLFSLLLFEKFSNQQNSFHFIYIKLCRCDKFNLNNLIVFLSSFASFSNRSRLSFMINIFMKFLNVNIFEENSKDSKIFKVIETTEKIYNFDKFNFNDFMTDI